MLITKAPVKDVVHTLPLTSREAVYLRKLLWMAGLAVLKGHEAGHRERDTFSIDLMNGLKP